LIIISVGEYHEVDQDEGAQNVGLVLRAGVGWEREAVVVDHTPAQKRTQSAARKNVFHASNDVLLRRILDVDLVNFAAATWGKAVFIAANVLLDHMRGGVGGIRHLPIKLSTHRRHASPILRGCSQLLVRCWVERVNLLWPGHHAAADERALERPLEAQNFGLIITGTHVSVHGERTVAATADLVKALALFRRIEQAPLVLEDTVGPRLMRIHVKRKRTNVVLISDQANAKIFEAKTLTNKQAGVVMKDSAIVVHLLSGRPTRRRIPLLPG